MIDIDVGHSSVPQHCMGGCFGRHLPDWSAPVQWGDLPILNPSERHKIKFGKGFHQQQLIKKGMKTYSLKVKPPGTKHGLFSEVPMFYFHESWRKSRHRTWHLTRCAQVDSMCSVALSWVKNHNIMAQLQYDPWTIFGSSVSDPVNLFKNRWPLAVLISLCAKYRFLSDPDQVSCAYSSNMG